MKNILPAFTIAASLLCGSQALANPQDAVNTGTAKGNNYFQKATDKATAAIIKKAVTFAVGKVVGGAVGELLNSGAVNANEDAAVKKMKEQWERQQNSRVPSPSRKPSKP